MVAGQGQQGRAESLQFSTLVIKGLGFGTLDTALLGIPQGAFVVVWIAAGALINEYALPKNSRTIVCAVCLNSLK